MTVTYNSVLGVFTPSIDLVINSSDLIPTATINQYKVSPEHLNNIDDFLANWETTWSQSLLIYHPEYCYTTVYNQLCELTSTSCGNISSDNYDATLQSVTTYTQAQGSTFGDLTIGSNIKDNDPFFLFEL